MNSKAFMVIRIIFGVLLVIFGSNKFFEFMPGPEEMPESILTYMTALVSTKTIYLVGLVEVVAGLSLVFNKLAALMVIILMSVSVNVVLFHATLSPGDIIGGIVLLILNIVMLVGYRHKYKELLN